MRFKRVGRDVSQLVGLDAKCFPYDTSLNPTEGTWFLLNDGDTPVAFGGYILDTEHSAYFIRGGVLPEYRGRGLYQRVLRYAARRAKADGVEGIWTYCMAFNTASANGLWGAGFKLIPESRLVYTADACLYFYRDLTA